MSVHVCSHIFLTTEHFVIKFGMVMQHHEPECHSEKFFFFSYFQGQVHSKGSYEQSMTLSTIYSELLIPWQSDLVR